MTTTEMINLLKIQGSFPTSQDLFNNADFLTLLDSQMKKEIVPLMLRVNEEYLLQTLDFTIASGATYRIPPRAVGAVIRDLKLVDSAGNISNINRLYEEDRSSSSTGFYVSRNSIQLSNDLTSGTLRMTYFAAPSSLVLPTSCGLISAINSGANQVTVTSAPSTFLVSTACDIVQGANPYDLLAMDSALTGVSGTTLTFTSLPIGLAIGDYVCLAKQSPVPLLPEELHPVLVQSALVATLSSKKDSALKFESEVLIKNINDAFNMLTPRAKNNSSKFRSGSLLSYISSRKY